MSSGSPLEAGILYFAIPHWSYLSPALICRTAPQTISKYTTRNPVIYDLRLAYKDGVNIGSSDD
jgi:hypothetical protein